MRAAVDRSDIECVTEQHYSHKYCAMRQQVSKRTCTQHKKESSTRYRQNRKNFLRKSCLVHTPRHTSAVLLELEAYLHTPHACHCMGQSSARQTVQKTADRGNRACRAHASTYMSILPLRSEIRVVVSLCRWMLHSTEAITATWQNTTRRTTRVVLVH